MYWNSLFHKSTTALSVIQAWFCWDFYGNSMSWQTPRGMRVPSQPRFSSSPAWLSDSSPLFSFHLTFENPFMPWLILRCPGHTLPDSRGALETASGFWKKFRTSDKAPNSPPGCWEELCGKCCPVPFPLHLSSHHPPCHWQWMEGSLQV